MGTGVCFSVLRSLGMTGLLTELGGGCVTVDVLVVAGGCVETIMVEVTLLGSALFAIDTNLVAISAFSW